MNFTETVKQAMKLKHINNVQLASMTGYSFQYISDILKGNKRWNETTINKVSAALGIEAQYIISDKSLILNQTGTD